MKITYGITVHNETESLKKLLDVLRSNIDKEDEILIVDDYSDNVETLAILEANSDIKCIKHHLNKDFGSHKNVINENATGQYVFQLDSDEYPHEVLLANLKDILEANPTTELFWVPRVNIVENMTQELVNRYGWRINEHGWVNWPDCQSRLYKLDYPRIKWDRKLHEHIIGYKTSTIFPQEEIFSLYHIKTAERQIKQNEFYLNNFTKSDNIRTA